MKVSTITTTALDVSLKYAPDATKQWFVLRASYGRTARARAILNADGVEYFYPFHTVVRFVLGKKRKMVEPLLPNLVFVYAGKEYMRDLMRNLGHDRLLTFYYNHFVIDEFGRNPPLIIDYKSMLDFIRIVETRNEHIRLVNPENCHYRNGDRVRIVDGEFRGIEGRVARVAGQQRVVVELRGLCLMATAYIPSAFLETIAGE